MSELVLWFHYVNSVCIWHIYLHRTATSVFFGPIFLSIIILFITFASLDFFFFVCDIWAGGHLITKHILTKLFTIAFPSMGNEESLINTWYIWGVGGSKVRTFKLHAEGVKPRITPRTFEVLIMHGLVVQRSINLPGMFLGCGRKSEYQEKTHTGSGGEHANSTQNGTLQCEVDHRPAC